MRCVFGVPHAWEPRTSVASRTPFPGRSTRTVSPVVDPVWQLLGQAYTHFGAVPTLLERDFNIPPLEELLGEVDRIIELQQPWRGKQAALTEARP